MPSGCQHQIKKIKRDERDQRELSDSADSKLVIVCRGITFALMALYIVGGPFYKQVLHGESTAFRAWRMFHSKGLGICDVEFYIRHPDGHIEIIDRFKTLGYDDFLKAPPFVRRMEGKEEVLYVGQLIRKKLGNRVDLRVNARIATRQGWKPLYSDERIK